MDTCDRSTLARQLCGAMLAPTVFEDASHGLFLLTSDAAVTGFVGSELCDGFEGAGATVIHLTMADVARGELWSAIAASVGRMMAAQTVDLPHESAACDRLPLLYGLQRLQRVSNRAVILMLDGIEHLTQDIHPDDWAAMFSLKSARDQMNRPGLCRLGLIMSSQSEDALARLVRSNASPFYGSSVRRLTLGRDLKAA